MPSTWIRSAQHSWPLTRESWPVTERPSSADVFFWGVNNSRTRPPVSLNFVKKLIETSAQFRWLKRRRRCVTAFDWRKPVRMRPTFVFSSRNPPSFQHNRSTGEAEISRKKKVAVSFKCLEIFCGQMSAVSFIGLRGACKFAAFFFRAATDGMNEVAGQKLPFWL